MGKTLAAVYSGHQFGVWAGQLGDGRAHLLGRVVGPKANCELQLKGSGQTPYSRMGDGRAVLRSSIREYLASHAMHALGIPTTEALAILCSDDPVYREQVEKAAIVVRTAPTFIRFGSFEHWHQQPKQLAALLRYTLTHFFPHLCPKDHELSTHKLELSDALVVQWFTEVVQRTAKLIAHWQVVGFCHGVMNTDNMSVLGLTIDYGPYAFMDNFHYAFTPNTTDRAGRYSWYQQPPVAFWNLSRLGSVLTHLKIDAKLLQSALEHFEPSFWHEYNQLMRQKLGLNKSFSDEAAFFDRWWKLLNDGQADVTLSFRYLAEYPENKEKFKALFLTKAHSALDTWLQEYTGYLQKDNLQPEDRKKMMNAHNPLYVLRNHLAHRCITAAEKGDYAPLAEAFEVLSQPYTEQEGMQHWAEPPTQDEQIPMLSCSS